MLLLSFPCISHLSGYCAKGQMFLMELTQHKVHCVFCGTFSEDGDSCYTTEYIVTYRLFLIFVVSHPL